MRKGSYFLFVPALIVLLLAGCSSKVISTGSGGGGTGGNATVSLSMTDDPPAGVSVLFFQIDLTAASLQSSTGTSVSLLSGNTPVQIDVTQLQALSAFLSTASVPGGQYDSMSLTFANPQIVIYNGADTSLSNCAVGSVCSITPSVDGSATVSLTTAPFPVTLSAGSPLGFLIDFHLNNVIQPDLSVNLGASEGVTVSELPPVPAPTPPQFGFLTGTVQSVNGADDSFTLLTAWGRTFTLGTTSTTTYDDFPSSACTTAGFGCLAEGQIVQVQIAGVASGGALTASQVTYVQAQGQQAIVGTVVQILPQPTPAGETIVDVLLHASPTAGTNLPPGALATVALWDPGSGQTPATTFSIDSNGFTIPSGFTFASTNDLAVGQTLQLTVAPGTLVGPTGTGSQNPWSPPVELSFTASSAALEPSQITGTVSDIGSSTFTLNWIYAPVPVLPLEVLLQFNVQTTSQTAYQGFNPDSFSGIEEGDAVSVNGWLFRASGSGSVPYVPDNVVAQAVVLRPNAMY